MREIDNINEVDIDIEGRGFDDEELRLLYAKNQLILTNLSEYWKPLIVQGKTYFNYMHGHIFDSKTREIYEQVQQKICIEPKLMKPKINRIVGEVMKGKRSGKIVTEGGMSAEEVSTANLILKYFENKIKEQENLSEMLFNGCVSCTPQVAMFDLAKTAYGDQMAGLTFEVLKWDTFVLNKYLNKTDGSDAHTLIRIARKSKNELINENLNRKKEIDEHYKFLDRAETDSQEMLEHTTGLTVEDARFLYYDILAGATHTGLDGRMLCCERLSPVKVKAEVAIATETEGDNTLDYQMRPGTWNDERWEAWKKQNADKYVYAEIEINALWQSRWTQEGLMLQNKLHWFQEHDDKGNPILPCVIFIPQIVDGLPTGPGADMQQKLLMKAISETEYLHDVRCGSGDLFVYKKGSLENSEDLPTELSIGNGIGVADPKFPGKIRDNMDFLKRTANDSYKNYSEKVDRDMDDETLLTRGVMGAHSPEQSNVAKTTEISQALIGYSFLSDSFNKSYFKAKNLELMMIPYVFTEEQVIEISDDEEQEIQTVSVNQKENDLDGNEIGVTNDLSSVKWRWRLVPGDDSPTARQQELNEMLIFWNTAAPTLIQADETLTLLSSVLMSMGGNKTAKETGSVIAEKAQVQAEQMNQQQMAKLMAELEERKAKTEAEKIKAMRSGFSFSITPEDLAYIPGMYDILVQGNYINTGGNNQFQLPQEAQPASAAA
ncbi:MAG TPA: hypothetical protein VMV77_16750 [Bacteroidales bacterium]|nr:hypothetical protein [Bacteroidales bacterium]